MKRNIKEITDREAKELFKYVFPKEKYPNLYYKGLNLEPIINEDGSRKVTFGMRDPIGIQYKNDMGDGCVLHFDHTKAVSWLYRNGFDVSEQLEENEFMSEESAHLDMFYFSMKMFKKQCMEIWEDKNHERKSKITVDSIFKSITDKLNYTEKKLDELYNE